MEAHLYEIGVILGVAIYEIIVRLKPTNRNWSSISLLGRAANFCLPNKAKRGHTYKDTNLRFKEGKEIHISAKTINRIDINGKDKK